MTASHRGPFTVWLASYPKSGNTWARAVLQALVPPGTARPATGGDPTRPARPGSGRELDINALEGGPAASGRHSIDVQLGFASSDLLPDEIDALRPACDAALDAELDGVRFRKIHDALFSGADTTPIVPPAHTRAAVYLIRDPRDVAISFAHFAGRSPSRTVERMADPGATLAAGTRALSRHVRQRLGTWSHHVESWTRHAPFPVAVFRYEDLHADPVGEFGRMAAHAGLTVERHQVAAAVAAARFDRLRAQEAERGFREHSRASPAFFRRGIVGSWRDELTPDLIRRVETDHAATMRRFGYGTGIPVSGVGRAGGVRAWPGTAGSR